jgi:hypothetical protein
MIEMSKREPADELRGAADFTEVERKMVMAVCKNVWLHAERESRGKCYDIVEHMLEIDPIEAMHLVDHGCRVVKAENDLWLAQKRLERK